MTVGTHVVAQDFMKGSNAWAAGDFAKALQEWTPLAEAGDAYAQYNLGVMYQNGDGVPPDPKETAKWYRLAAEQGHVNAQLGLGAMYIDGRGVPQVNTVGHMWLNIASANGNEISGTIRDNAERTMTPAAIEKAQAMAYQCMNSGYTKCEY